MHLTWYATGRLDPICNVQSVLDAINILNTSDNTQEHCIAKNVESPCRTGNTHKRCVTHYCCSLMLVNYGEVQAVPSLLSYHACLSGCRKHHAACRDFHTHILPLHCMHVTLQVCVARQVVPQMKCCWKHCIHYTASAAFLLLQCFYCIPSGTLQCTGALLSACNALSFSRHS